MYNCRRQPKPPSKEGQMKTLISCFVMFVCGCSAFTEVNAPFVSGNQSSNQTVVTVVNGNEVGHDMGPGGSSSFTIRVQIANSSSSYSTEPAVDKSTTVGIRYRVRGAHPLITDEVPCQAGAKLVTHSSFKTYGTGSQQYVQVDCWTSYTSYMSYDLRAVDSTSYKVQLVADLPIIALPDTR